MEPVTLSTTVTANADGSQTRFSHVPMKVCNGTLFTTGAAVTVLTSGGATVGTLSVGSGLDVTAQDLSALYFSGAGATLGFFGTVYQGS